MTALFTVVRSLALATLLLGPTGCALLDGVSLPADAKSGAATSLERIDDLASAALRFSDTVAKVAEMGGRPDIAAGVRTGAITAKQARARLVDAGILKADPATDGASANSGPFNGLGTKVDFTVILTNDAVIVSSQIRQIVRTQTPIPEPLPPPIVETFTPDAFVGVIPGTRSGAGTAPTPPQTPNILMPTSADLDALEAAAAAEAAALAGAGAGGSGD